MGAGGELPLPPVPQGADPGPSPEPSPEPGSETRPEPSSETRAEPSPEPRPDPRFAELGFHPACAQWFQSQLGQPTDLQWQAWQAHGGGRDLVLEAPTGTGKTLAAFFRPLDGLVREALSGQLRPGVQVLYVSPLRALSADIAANLLRPLQGVGQLLARDGAIDPQAGLGIQVQVRTSDTTASQRAAMRRQPPHILVTTPESLFLLLTSASGRRALADVRQVVVDEVHALAGTKRGAHLALSLERLTGVCGRRPPRMALSATQNPISAIAAYIAGAPGAAPAATPEGKGQEAQGTGEAQNLEPQEPLLLRAAQARREMDLGIELPLDNLGTLLSGEDWAQIHRRLLELIARHTTTLVFVNNRRLCERLSRSLQELSGPDAPPGAGGIGPGSDVGGGIGGEKGDIGEIGAHHGSLSKETRHRVEEGLRQGRYRAVVATASLELGIDIGAVDLVCQIGSPHSVGVAVQRFGRSGRGFGAMPKGRLFPTTSADLAECAALLGKVRGGALDRLRLCETPLDVLSQQLVAEVAAGGERSLDDLYALCRRAWPYRGLPRADFDQVVAMLGQNFGDSRGRRGALVHPGAAPGSLAPRSHAGMTAMLNVGCIPDQFDFEVVLDPQGQKVGTVHEDFALEAMLGDVFQLGNHSYRLLRFDRDKLRVGDADGVWPNLPFWRGEAPGRTDLVSDAVDGLRRRFAQLWQEAAGGSPAPRDARLAAVAETLAQEWRLQEHAALALCDHLAAGMEALGVMPLRDQLVIERFFDDAGEAHLVLHAPLGSRILKAWGLALRKKFCRRFNFELQAAALDEGLILSLGSTHAFPVEEPAGYLRSDSVGQVLQQALLDAPAFPTHWRWNAATALALRRRSSSGRVPPPIQRAQAEDLMALVFPDQLACLENLAGEREVPDHPLVRQTMHDCSHELMDLSGLQAALRRLESGEMRVLGVDTPAPSVFAQALVSAQPYAFLDDGELEDRRTRAVSTGGPGGAASPGSMAPVAAGPVPAELVESVRAMVRPKLRSAGELAEVLDWLVALPAAQAKALQVPDEWLAAAQKEGFVAAIDEGIGEGKGEIWVRADRAALAQGLWAGQGGPEAGKAEEELLHEALRSWLEILVVATAEDLASTLHLPLPRVRAGLAALEQVGYALPGIEVQGRADSSYCPKHLFSRLQRMRQERRRSGVRPLPLRAFQRFLVRWHGLGGAGQPAEGRGPDGLERSLAQLQGFAAQAASWEQDILPGRIGHYDPADLDQLGLGGGLQWLRRPASPVPPSAVQPPPAASPAGVGAGAGGGQAPLPAVPGAALRSGSLLFPALPGQQLRALQPAPPEPKALGGRAQRLLEWCLRAGPCFAGQILHESGLLPEEAEQALRELLGAGALRCDSFAAVRSLAGLPGAVRLDKVPGRWYIPQPAPPEQEGSEGEAGQGGQQSLQGQGWQHWDEEDIRALARQWLRRWGVFFFALYQRELSLGRPWAPPWRRMLRCLRLMEESGELLCGRFVEGVHGEQFALPEAAAALRSGAERECGLAVVSACDPLNLTGYLDAPGEGDARVPAQHGNRLLLRDGQAVAALRGGELVALQPGWRGDLQESAWLTDPNPYGGPGMRPPPPGHRPRPSRPPSRARRMDAQRRAARITSARPR